MAAGLGESLLAFGVKFNANTVEQGLDNDRTQMLLDVRLSRVVAWVKISYTCARAPAEWQCRRRVLAGVSVRGCMH